MRADITRIHRDERVIKLHSKTPLVRLTGCTGPDMATGTEKSSRCDGGLGVGAGGGVP